MTGVDPIARLHGAMRGPLAPSSDFDLNPSFRPPADTPLRPAGVLILADPSAGTVYLTKRASTLKHHPGQIAFPGGKVDPQDDGQPTAAALREANEEIGLPPDAATVLGTLSAHQTITGFLVTPVLALLNGPFTPRPEAGEVAEVFTVPLAHVLDPANFLVQSRLWRGTRRYYYTVPYGPYYIWGATARMLRVLAESPAP